MFTSGGRRDVAPLFRRSSGRANRPYALVGAALVGAALVGAVSFVGGRRVEPKSAADLERPDAPEFALAQFDPAERKDFVPERYVVLAERSFGPRRTVRLLHRASSAATPAAPTR